MKKLWKKHKVFITGTLFAICTATLDLLYSNPVDYWVLGFAAISAAGSYLSENLPGRGATIAGAFAGNLIISLGHFRDGETDLLQMSLFLLVSLGVQISGAQYTPDKKKK